MSVGEFGRFPKPDVLTIAGRRVAVHCAGSAQGVPVVLLHGGGLDRASLSWRLLLPRLAAVRLVIAPDWPGYGGSEGFGRDHTLGELGRWLVQLLDPLGADRVDVVGISMGGGAALQLALDHPERVRRVVAADAYGLQRRAPFHFASWLLTRLPLGAASGAILARSRWATRRALANIFADPDRITDGLVSEVMDVVRTSGGLATFGRFQRGEIGPRELRTVLTPGLDQLGAPTLIVHGRHDRLVPLADAERAAKRLPNADLAVLDAGHWPMREVPDPFNRTVERFLANTR